MAVTVPRSSPSGEPAASILRGSNMTVDTDGKLRPIAASRRFWEWDYFDTGGVASGQIGRMGWNLLGLGTPAYARIDGNLASPVKGALSTSNVASNRSGLLLGSAENMTVMTPLESYVSQGVWRMAGSLATKRAFFGFSSDFALNPITGNVNALGLAYDSGVSPNYLLVNRIGLTLGAATDTTVAVPVNTGQLISIAQSETVPGEFEFYLGSDASQSVLLGRVNLPVVTGYAANFGFGVTTLGASVATVEVGYWGLTTVVLPGILSTDSYIQGMADT